MDDIIDFSELREFIDNPVRTYSSGMYMRKPLGFSIKITDFVGISSSFAEISPFLYASRCCSPKNSDWRIYMKLIHDLYNYRELLKSNVKKEIRGKYKGSFLEMVLL